MIALYCACITPLVKDFRLYLQEELVARCRKNPRYSLRSFAKSIGVNHGILSMVLRQKRELTPELVQKIGLSLGLGKRDLDQYLRSIPASSGLAATRKERVKKINQMTVDTFNVVSDWYHDAILELSRVEGFEPTPEYISKRLGITRAEAHAAIERLIRVGLIEVAPNGTWVETLGDNTTAIDVDFTNTALRRLQKQVLALSQTALESLPKVERDHTCMTMAINPRDLHEAKKRIKTFRQELMSFLQRDGTEFSEVYQLAVSIYPLSRKQS